MIDSAFSIDGVIGFFMAQRQARDYWKVEIEVNHVGNKTSSMVQLFCLLRSLRFYRKFHRISSVFKYLFTSTAAAPGFVGFDFTSHRSDNRNSRDLLCFGHVEELHIFIPGYHNNSDG